MKVIQLTQEHTQILTKFCREANAAGYRNNSSLEDMKFGKKYDFEEPAEFWAVVDSQKIISVSGCHITNNSVRCLFRSATLPEYDTVVPGLNKHHMNSLPFSVLMPQQIYFGIDRNIKDFYITTSNGEHDASGKMKRTHRALQLLERTGMVSHAGNEWLYNVEQSIWKLNLDKYLSALRSFDKTRLVVGIEPTNEYLVLLRNNLTPGANSSMVEEPSILK